MKCLMYTNQIYRETVYEDRFFICIMLYILLIHQLSYHFILPINMCYGFTEKFKSNLFLPYTVLYLCMNKKQTKCINRCTYISFI